MNITIARIAERLSSDDDAEQNVGLNELNRLSEDGCVGSDVADAVVELLCQILREPSPLPNAASYRQLACGLLPRFLSKKSYAGADLRGPISERST